jgi:cysteine desulfurase / selenocysteine lyase
MQYISKCEQIDWFFTQEARMATMIDLEQVRRDTPSCQSRIHLNHCGSSPMPAIVKEIMIEHLELETTLGGYQAHDQVMPAFTDFYTAFAELFNCQSQEIAFAESATRAWDMIFYALEFKSGDRILTCQSEYLSNYLAFLHMVNKTGVVIDVAPDDEYGQVDVIGMEAMIGPRTKLIAMTHVPTQGGLVNPAQAVGALARAHGVPYLLDACQSVGQLHLDVQSIGCDFLTGTGRKFLRGPRGTGFLYAKHERLLELHPPFVDGHAAQWISSQQYALHPNATRFEGWERNIAAHIGLRAAVRYALELGMSNIETRVRALAKYYRQKLKAIPSIELTDLGSKPCGIVTFRKIGEDPKSTISRLEAAGISASVSAFPWGALDFQARGINSLVRTSVHYFNTEAEIDRVCSLI